PRIRTPEVVRPQKTALEQVVAKMRRFHSADRRRPDFRHHDERTVEHLGIGELDQQWTRFSADVAAYGGLGQLGQPNRQVDVSARVVHAPVAAAVTAWIAAERDAAE